MGADAGRRNKLQEQAAKKKVAKVAVETPRTVTAPTALAAPYGTAKRPLRLEYIEASQLADNPRNWRLHPAEQLQALDTLMTEVGWAGALLYNEQTGRLLDGHGRKQLFMDRGGEVPVLIGSWDEAAEQKILASLDSLGDLAEVDQEKLSELRGLVEASASASAAVLGALDAAVQPKLLHQTITVPTVSLKKHPGNYKEHPPEQIEHIIASIEANGTYRPIVVARDNTILAGHGLWMALTRLGQARTQVIRLPLAADDPQAMKLVVADNEIGALAARDDRKLSDLLKSIDGTLGELLGTGFDRMALANLVYVTRRRDEISDFNAAADFAALGIEYTPGELRCTLVMQFKEESDREKFVKLHGIQLAKQGKRAWSAWWPPRAGSEDIWSTRWVASDEQKAEMKEAGQRLDLTP